VYSQLSMEGENSTHEYKPLGIENNLGLISKIDELNSTEGDPLNGEN